MTLSQSPASPIGAAPQAGKHTPGPWHWDDSAGHRSREMPKLVGATGIVCDFGDAERYYPTEGTPPNDADAALIAAAPDFLAALRQVANWELPPTGKFWDEEKTRPTSFEAEYGSNGARSYMQALARAALAKDVLEGGK